MQPTTYRDSNSVTESLREPLLRVVMGYDSWPLFLYGPAGTGKTCAALVLCDHYLGQYWKLDDLCSELRADIKRNKDDQREWDIWDCWSRWQLAVLDEVGVRDHPSDFEYGVVKRCIDLRSGKPLIVMSNVDIDEIERLYDDRIASRMSAGTVVRLQGEDRRLSDKAPW